MNVELDQGSVRTSSAAAQPLRIGVDIGGTSIDAVLIDSQMSVVRSANLPTRKGGDSITEDLFTVLSELTEFAEKERRSVSGVGIGTPGTIEHSTGIIRQAVNLGVTELDVRELVQRRYGVAVSVENDVNAAALAAANLMGVTSGTCAFLNLGTGTALGVVIDGAIFSGATGAVGEIGHIPLDPLGEQCPCGQRGCLETLISGSGIARLWPTDNPLPAADLFEKAESGNPAAARLRKRIWRGMAQALQLIAQAYDPVTIVVGGGVSKLGDVLMKGAKEELALIEERSVFVASLKIMDRVAVMSDLEHVGAIGAALCAR